MRTEIINGITVITADNDNVFITKDNIVLSGQLYLGCNDNAENYKEIPLAEAEMIFNEETVQTES